MSTEDPPPARPPADPAPSRVDPSPSADASPSTPGHPAAEPSGSSSPRSRTVWITAIATIAILALITAVWALRPSPPLVASSDETSASQSPSGSPDDSASQSPAPSGSVSPSPEPTAPPANAAAVPVYVVATSAPDSSRLGLRRLWVPVTTEDTPAARAKAAVTEAMARPAGTNEQTHPWAGVAVRDVQVGKDRIDITLTALPTTPAADDLARFAVDQLAWTAQAAAGSGNVPVKVTPPGGVTMLWTIDVSTPFTRPPRDEWHNVLTPLWITEPYVIEGQDTVVDARAPLTVRGEAAVFEGTVQWEASQPDGTVVERGHVTASEGGPGRGTFEIDVPPLQPGTWTIRAFSLSAEDGKTVVASDRITVIAR